jgi:hypothetical protein
VTTSQFFWEMLLEGDYCPVKRTGAAYCRANSWYNVVWKLKVKFASSGGTSTGKTP